MSDLLQGERFQVREGDALSVLRTLPDGCLDCVVTSPPYAEQRKGLYGGISEEEYPAWAVSWMEALRQALKPKGSVLINIREHIRDGQISDYVLKTRLALREARWIECEELIWIKPDGMPVGSIYRPRRCWERILWFSHSGQPFTDVTINGCPSSRLGGRGVSLNAQSWLHSGQTSVAHSGIARSKDYIEVPVSFQPSGIAHPAAYPVSLAEWMINLVCPSSGTVCDPFMGSGTTGVAALNTGRRFLGIELSPEYAAMARRRIETLPSYTGAKRSVKVTDGQLSLLEVA